MSSLRHYSYVLLHEQLLEHALWSMPPKTKQVKRAVRSMCCVLGGDQGGEKEKKRGKKKSSKRRPEKTHRSASYCYFGNVVFGWLHDEPGGKPLYEHIRVLHHTRPHTTWRRAAAHRGASEENKAIESFFIPGSAAAEFQPHRSWLLTPARLLAGLRHTPLCQCLAQKKKKYRVEKWRRVSSQRSIMFCSTANGHVEGKNTSKTSLKVKKHQYSYFNLLFIFSTKKILPDKIVAARGQGWENFLTCGTQLSLKFNRGAGAGAHRWVLMAHITYVERMYVCMSTGNWPINIWHYLLKTLKKYH